MSLQHVVLFRFPEPLDDAQAGEMRALVQEWPDRIGGFERLRFGTDLSDGARARGYQFLLLTEHADQAALTAYQQHPVHLAFGDWVYSRGCEVIAFDYQLGPDTVLIS
jgi:hypothetical protein